MDLIICDAIGPVVGFEQPFSFNITSIRVLQRERAERTLLAYEPGCLDYFYDRVRCSRQFLLKYAAHLHARTVIVSEPDIDQELLNCDIFVELTARGRSIHTALRPIVRHIDLFSVTLNEYRGPFILLIAAGRTSHLELLEDFKVHKVIVEIYKPRRPSTMYLQGRGGVLPGSLHCPIIVKVSSKTTLIVAEEWSNHVTIEQVE